MSFATEGVLKIPRTMQGDKIAVVLDGTGRNVQLMCKHFSRSIIETELSLPYYLLGVLPDIPAKGEEGVFTLPHNSVQLFVSLATVLLPGKTVADYGGESPTGSNWSVGVYCFSELPDGSLMPMCAVGVSSGYFGKAPDGSSGVITVPGNTSGELCILHQSYLGETMTYLPPGVTHIRCFLTSSSLGSISLKDTIGRVVIGVLHQGYIEGMSPSMPMYLTLNSADPIQP